MKTAYPQTNTTCSIILFSNIPFDNSYKHHCLISSLFTYNNTSLYSGTGQLANPVTRFISRFKEGSILPYYPLYSISGEFNFDFQNGLLGSVVLELTPAQTNANYMVLTCGSDKYYYFITGIQQINGDTYKLSLELDVLMTYQDEFLTGMKDVPVFTARKHCHRYTNDGLYPHCADFKHGENIYAGVKPSIIKKKEQLNISMTGATNINNIKWLYICVDGDFTHEGSSSPTPTDLEIWNTDRYRYKDVRFPLIMICIPLNVNSLIITNADSSVRFEITSDMFQRMFNNLVGSGKVHGAKISPYPPFILREYELASLSDAGVLTIITPNITISNSPRVGYYSWENKKCNVNYLTGYTYLIITNEKDEDFTLSKATLDMANASAPTILSNRFSEPKLLFAPFKKYVLSATYNNGNEFFPELIYSDGVYKSNYFNFKNVYNYYIGDYSIFSYQDEINDANNNKFYEHFKANNIGLSATINYIVPSGTNALAVFNSTQSNTFYQSKIATGITSGLSIAGGIASIALGAGMTATSGGGLTPIGTKLVAGGALAISGGTASFVNNIKSYNAKIEDLKNTPDSINVQGSSFVGDYSRNNTLPFVVTYDVTSAIKEQANDYFYSNGYEVARDCYFNTELKYDNDLSGITDNNLFGRTIFNYIQINEDITNKINADIPHIIKQKLSSIFNNGITLWSFFGNASLWGGEPIPTATNNPDKWFMKHTLDNTEYNG